MQTKLVELRAHWTSLGNRWHEIVHEMKMRIGINSGDIVTGNMGSAKRMNYTMMGDSVNLAARLEEAAKQYGIYVQLSEFTKNLLPHPEEFILREIDTIRVVGKSEPVTTYELMGIEDESPQEVKTLLSEFAKGIELYKNQQWDEATAIFESTRELEKFRFSDQVKTKTNPSEIYIERCKQFKENPPPADWDGVYTLTSK